MSVAPPTSSLRPSTAMPTSVRKQTGLGVGVLLEAKVERGKITLTPKGLIDRKLALADRLSP